MSSQGRNISVQKRLTIFFSITNVLYVFTIDFKALKILRSNTKSFSDPLIKKNLLFIFNYVLIFIAIVICYVFILNKTFEYYLYKKMRQIVTMDIEVYV